MPSQSRPRAQAMCLTAWITATIRKPQARAATMTFDLTFYALAIPAVFVVGFSKGGFGSGAGIVVTPVLLLVLPPAMVVGVMLPVMMAIDVVTFKPYWRKWVWRAARPLILGGVVGALLGAAFWKVADADTIRLLIGVMTLVFTAYALAGKLGWAPSTDVPRSTMFGQAMGAIAGFTSFVAHAGGPAGTIYLLSQKLTKTEFQATTIVTFWWMNVAKAILYVPLGLFTVESLAAGLWLIPAGFLGAWAGVKAHRVVPQWAFFAGMYVALPLVGCKLIYDALT